MERAAGQLPLATLAILCGDVLCADDGRGATRPLMQNRRRGSYAGAGGRQEFACEGGLAKRANCIDPEKWEPVFPRDKRQRRLRADHAQTTRWTTSMIQPS